ncbi:MAG: thioredoxin domain-containing protein [Candidatus Omnitrophica bacterium]|nr:thioredoxin domain-containing protein [Candidatus Omnitrophota bacterium]
MPKKNRLADESSPYLLQHAMNPVDWYPWGNEAFTKAKEQDKPVLLSIGYATCHWCHVMEQESFANENVAEVINEYFIPVKVDREERPDIDQVYMSVVLAINGQGGWPLTVMLTPDQQPFFGGTYFPPYAKWGNPGLVEIMERIHQLWVSDRPQLYKTGKELTDYLNNKDQSPERSSVKHIPG